MSDEEKENRLKEYEGEKQKILRLLTDRKFNNSAYAYRNEGKGKTVDEQLARRKELENNNLEQDIKLKKYTLIVLFVFLMIETFLIFLYTLFQAINLCDFHLEEWSFRLLIGATITQITAMLTIAVQYLFPRE